MLYIIAAAVLLPIVVYGFTVEARLNGNDTRRLELEELIEARFQATLAALERIESRLESIVP